MAKRRLDMLLVDKGLFPSREKAKTSIMAGLVTVNGQRVDKPGTDVAEDAALEVRGAAIPYVSRGGLKLAKAIEEFGLDFTGKVVMDIGASTGGFTDCALQHGAALVYAVDVGYGQLAWSLRQNPRVINMERTNIRHLDPAGLEHLPDFVTTDVAFISLRLVLPKIREILSAGGAAVVLIKPQFEAGREKVGKKGVVRDPQVHEEVIENVIGFARQNGFAAIGLSYSPVTGPEGNIEYLLYLNTISGANRVISIEDLVKEAHKAVGNS